MKRKGLTYFLIPMVVLIWGAIIYKIVAGKDNSSPSNITPTVSAITASDIKDTFELKINYRDPFLSELFLPVEEAPIDENIEVKPVTTVENGNRNVSSPVIIEIPDLKYFGVIANQKNNQKIGLFRLNNKSAILKEGDLFEDFNIVSIFKDSVKINFKGSKKTIRKK